MFQNRTISLATMHEKESIIAPLFKAEFNAELVVPKNINTDLFGTFLGDIKRTKDPLSIAFEKCAKGMQLCGTNIGLASEGSFGAHPNLPFLTANEEIIVLWDKKNNLKLEGYHLTTETNFAGSLVNSLKEAEEFAERIGFPEHALIIKSFEHDNINARKGINNYDDLTRLVLAFLEQNKSCWIETDMRSMYNPMRQKSIKNATKNIISKLLSHCPKCKTPGFSVSEVLRGLPCEWCNTPTNSISAHILKCKKCDYSNVTEFPNGCKFESPQYCPNCNP